MISLFRHYVLHNFSLKLLSLLLATFLWFTISRGEQPAVVAIRVPIEFQHLPDGLEISSQNIPEAQIRVQGPERVVGQLRSTDVRVEIDIAGAQPGERTFDLTAQQIHMPKGLTAEQVVPGQVHLDFDARMTREVEIHPRVTGEFLAGEQIAKLLVDPERITITGPRHHVEMVDAATTDPVDASGTTTEATFTTTVYVSDPLVQVVKPAPVRVTVVMEKTSPGPNRH
ncbi:MAG: CdaR family protein [Candidatus Sulfotelmatobacter sp.]